jgi:hypothetical protein
MFGIIAVSVWSAKNKIKEPAKNTIDVPETVTLVTTLTIPTSGKYCFARIQKVTDVAPYAVEEHIVLNFDGTKVTGTKRGTQSGPDMTNGYEGILAGSTIPNKTGGEMELIFVYTVEGSQNKEFEVYVIDNMKLIKKRWVLKETKINNQNILVPDYVGEPTLITYEVEDCAT